MMSQRLSFPHRSRDGSAAACAEREGRSVGRRCPRLVYSLLPRLRELAVKKVYGGLELNVLFLFPRNIGDASPRFLRPGILEVTPQLGLGFEREHGELQLQVRRKLGLDDVVRLNSRRLDRPAGGRIISGGCEPDRAFVRKRYHGLNRAFSEGPGPHELRSLMILQRPRHHFGSGSRSAIDQDNQRLSVRNVAGLRLGAIYIGGVAASRDNDDAPVEKSIGERDSLIEKAARIVPE